MAFLFVSLNYTNGAIKNQAILDWDERTPLKLVNVIKY